MDTECGFHTEPAGWYRLVITGPTIYIDLGFDPKFDTKVKNSVPDLQLKNVPALLDTGAQESFIDVSIAQKLQLPKVNEVEICGSIGKHPADVYLAQIRIPSLMLNIIGQFTGVNLTAAGQIHCALIGRTFLRTVTMLYDGLTGKVTVTRQRK